MADGIGSLGELAGALRAGGDAGATWAALLDYLHAHDIPLVSYHHIAPAAAAAGYPRPILTDGFPQDWVDHYIGDRLSLVDPIPELALRNAEPFLWSDAGGLAALAAGQQAYLRELTESGIGDGLAMQVFGPELRHGYFGLGFGPEGTAPPVEAVAELQMACQLAHLRYCAVTPLGRGPDAALTPREREILEWIARGKSNAVIAEILGLSGHTVDAHLRRIFAKLGVADRTSAAIRGLGSGMIRGEV